MFEHGGPKPLDPSLRQIAPDVVSFFSNALKR
jgi:hypothetical protein